MRRFSFSPKTLLGFASIAAGAVLAVFFWELRIFWFQGGPLGIALIVLGVLDLLDARRRAGGDAPAGLLQELRDDVVGPPRRPEARRGGDQESSEETAPRDADDAGRDG